MTHRSQLKSEDGWVMVPAIILLVVAIGVCMALLALVDGQTSESREQRSSDSAQTLAEGAVTATANVLAANQPLWPISGACQTVSGDLTAAAPAGTSLADRVSAELKARFAGTSSDFANTTTHVTAWQVDMCPVDAADTARWEETMLTRAGVTPVSAPAPASLWVRGHASVRSRTGATRVENARTVVSKIRQTSRTFDVPANFAVGTGVLSTDIGTTLSTTLLSNTALLGSMVKPLIAPQDSKIGVRCGVLVTIDNPNTTCLAGTMAGVAGITNATGLGRLNTILGLRNEALPTWTMAPNDAIEAWRTEAKRAGNVYSPASTPIAGYGNDVVATKSVSGDTPASGHDCFSGTTTSATVIFIEKVGNGDQYCNVPAGKTAKILIVERGAIRIKAGTFTGVVYALNKQECGSDGTCSADERKNATPREVVRIDGPNGKVVGSVWADGAGGAVGIYPAFAASNVTTASLLGVGDATTGICGVGVVNSLIGTLSTTLTGLLGSVTALLSNEEVRYPNGSTVSPGGCSLLKTDLGTLPASTLLDYYATGVSRTVATTIHRTRANILSPWSAWTTKTTALVNFPPLLTSSLPSVADQVAGLLGSPLNSYSAITYNAAAVTNAAAHINQGAAPIVGTYRNVGAST